MTDAPPQQSPDSDDVKDAIRDEHGEAAEATTSADSQEDQQSIAEEFEQDPARNPGNEALKNIKGG